MAKLLRNSLSEKGFTQQVIDWVDQDWKVTPIQEETYKHLLPTRHNAIPDMIIAGPTGSGKTEAVFLPLLNRLLTKESQPGFDIIYVSPLKALINDQVERLGTLSKLVGKSAYAWHGDISDTEKKAILKKAEGILLITPESIEGMFGRPGELRLLYNNVDAIVIDEIHAFFNTTRGRHLQSLLNRLELTAQEYGHTNKKIPRIGLSATLGEGDIKAASFLISPKDHEVIICKKEKQQEIDIHFSVFIEPDEKSGNTKKEEKSSERITQSIIHDFNQENRFLIFTDSRAGVEFYADKIKHSTLDKKFQLHAHHSSIAATLRKEAETAMKSEHNNSNPQTNIDLDQGIGIICTNTLELGIDIGKLSAVGQIGPTHTVASLRQRLGRSNRRGKNPVPVIRMYLTERNINNADHPLDKLRLGTIQALATIFLLHEQKFELPDDDHLHISTLLQQTLSILKQHRDNNDKTLDTEGLYKILIAAGPWKTSKQTLTKILFTNLLETLNWGKEKIVVWDNEKKWRLNDTKITIKGKEKWGLGKRYTTNNPSFYAAFQTPAEFSIYKGMVQIGKIPVTIPYQVGDTLMLSNQRWKISGILQDQRRIFVKETFNAAALKFGGDMQIPSDAIIFRMKKIYEDNNHNQLLAKYKIHLHDETARCISEGLRQFDELNLTDNPVITFGRDIILFPWSGAKLQRTLQLCLRNKGLMAVCLGPTIQISDCKLDSLDQALKNINTKTLETDELCRSMIVPEFDKHNWLLTPYYKRLAYSNSFLTKLGMDDLIHILLQNIQKINSTAKYVLKSK